jgi:hypothetical protein
MNTYAFWLGFQCMWTFIWGFNFALRPRIVNTYLIYSFLRAQAPHPHIFFLLAFKIFKREKPAYYALFGCL